MSEERLGMVPPERRRRGRPKQIWMDCVNRDMRAIGITKGEQALTMTLGLWVQWPGGPVDLKTYWPPKKLTGPFLKTKLARQKNICVNLQFAHIGILFIKLVL